MCEFVCRLRRRCRLGQLQKASSPGIRSVRPLEKCEVTLKETCGVVFVREVVKSPRMRTVQ